MIWAWLRNLFRRDIKFDDSQSITNVQIQRLLHKKGIAKSQIKTGDGEYILCDMDDVRKFLQRDLVDKKQYRKRIFDCDDFSFVLKGRACLELSGCCVGIVWVVKPDRGKHALNFFIDQDGDMWYIEPQTDEIFGGNDLKPYFAIV